MSVGVLFVRVIAGIPTALLYAAFAIADDDGGMPPGDLQIRFLNKPDSYVTISVRPFTGPTDVVRNKNRPPL